MSDLWMFGGCRKGNKRSFFFRTSEERSGGSATGTGECDLHLLLPINRQPFVGRFQHTEDHLVTRREFGLIGLFGFRSTRGVAHRYSIHTVVYYPYHHPREDHFWLWAERLLF